MIALTLCLTSSPAHGQFVSSVSIVEVYATVVDGRGEPVTGLARESFTVSEAGVPQVIEVFAAGEVPLSVAIAVDRSFSMAGPRLALAKAAARALLGALRVHDEAAVLAIGSQVAPLAPLSTDRATQLDAVRGIDAFGTTGLYDAVSQAVALVQSGSGRRVLVLVTDGGERYSTIGAEAALEQARRGNVIVYPIVLGPTVSSFLHTLATTTGGQAVTLKDARTVDRTTDRIVRELRAQYLLGYAPTDAGTAGEWRAIRVTVNSVTAAVLARAGYYAPRR